MRIASVIIVTSVLIGAATLALLGASAAATMIERASKDRIQLALAEGAIDWAKVDTDGLRIHLSGTAPTEAARFRALAVAGAVVDAHRISDQMEVEAAVIAAPRFSVEILRNDDGISLIGLIPGASDREAIVSRISEIADGGRVADMLETADYDTPNGWPVTLDYAVQALELLPRSKISVEAGLLTITAISDSAEQRNALETSLLEDVPPGIELILDISAPRPVITPFTLRFLIEDGKGHFDACAADTERARTRILAAAAQVSTGTEADCQIALGNPSPHWATAVETAIGALAEIGAGSVTFSDADVTLVAKEGTPRGVFDRVSAELEADLPALFSLHAVLPESAEAGASDAGPPEFTATLSPEKLVQLRGRVTNERSRTATRAFAHARFGAEQVYMATNLDPELPDGWPLRVLAGVEALSYLDSGGVVIRPEVVDVHGVTGDPNASATISRLLSDKLGEAENFEVNVSYNERLDPVADVPTPQECVDKINGVLNETKLTFAPGSADFEAGVGGTLNAIADILKECEEVPMEIAGHTDSQGRETMNQNLSQSRANAVLNALMARRVLTSNLSAQGYGETIPIADNETEEGREANRRIEFTLRVDDDPGAEGEGAPQSTTEEPPEEAGTDEQD